MAAAASPADAFFDDLVSRGHEPLVRSADGSIRWDVVNGDRTDHWYVTMHAGEIGVSHRRSKADAVVRVDRETFEGMVTGTVNAMAAVLRGEVAPEGDLRIMMLFQRLFPAPPRGGHAHG